MEADADLTELMRELPLTGDLAGRVTQFLVGHGCAHTAAHAKAVAVKAVDLARRFGVDVIQAETGAWLHDVSAVIPSASRVAFAGRYGISMLDEEARVPMILHQKLSALLAQRLFGITDDAVLAAIACHTTLRQDATTLDKVVFLADKIAWDQVGVPPYLADLNRALSMSLDAAVCVYLGTLWAQRASLPVVHPWMVAAYAQICAAPQ